MKPIRLPNYLKHGLKDCVLYPVKNKWDLSVMEYEGNTKKISTIHSLQEGDNCLSCGFYVWSNKDRGYFYWTEDIEEAINLYNDFILNECKK